MSISKEKINEFLNKSFLDRNKPIEIRLWYYFIIVEAVWSLLNCVICAVLQIPFIVTSAFLLTFVFLIVFALLGLLTRKHDLVRKIYLASMLIAIPLNWINIGGPKTSGGILFICEIVIFIMCTKSREIFVFVPISLFLTGAVQSMSARGVLPDIPLTEIHIRQINSFVGLSTSVMIALLLLGHKYEYIAERDRALESERNLEKSNSLQKNFLANMSHEIRSPLGIVMGFNNLIKDSTDIDQIHQYSNDITYAGTTLLTVINDILDYSKIESGKLDIIEDSYSFEALTSSIMREIDLKCRDKGLSFITKIDSKIPNYLYGDNVRIKQCLLNVLSNAVKYTDKGTVSLSADLKGQTDDGVYSIEFKVEDTGKGISKEALPNIFSAFQRLDEGMNRGIEGTGLGMAITKNLLDEMHGSIDIQSEFGVGTTIIIRLDQTLGETKYDDTGIDFKADLSGINVLVVDDTTLNLTLVRKLLEKEGASVTTCDNGKECLSIVAAQKFDIILLDHMMPEMNGVEVYGRMKGQNGPNSNTPVVMLTANAMAGAAQEYLEMGFDGYLSKPISQKDLKKTVIRLGRHY